MEVTKHNPSEIMANWRIRVKNEQDTSKNWSSEWGFLVPDHASKSSDVYDSSKRAQFNSTISLNKNDLALKATEKEKCGDALDTFVHNYVKRNGGGRPLPKDEYRAPVTTSMDIGWHKNLEKFGKLSLHMR